MNVHDESPGVCHLVVLLLLRCPVDTQPVRSAKPRDPAAATAEEVDVFTGETIPADCEQ